MTNPAVLTFPAVHFSAQAKSWSAFDFAPDARRRSKRSISASDNCDSIDIASLGSSIFGALWLGDSFAGFLTAGGKATFYYHALPYSPPHPVCSNSWGTYHMFMTDKSYQIKQRTSQFFAAQLLTQEWAQPVDEDHKLYRASSDIKDVAGHVLVTAYPLLRPDGRWSLLLINKDHDHAHTLKISFHDEGASSDSFLSGRMEMITFGGDQYQWHPAGKNGYADPDGPPAASTFDAAESTVYTLPPASINVLRGKLSTSH